MRRFAPVLAGIAFTGVLALLLSGTGDGGPGMPLFGIVVVALVVPALLYLRRGPDAEERSWSTAPLATPGPADRPDPASAPAVARALGRVEARELSKSVWFGVGIGFCLLIFVLFGWVYDNSGEPWDKFIQLAPWFALPLVGMTVLAGHRAATRAARDHADELFDTCPADPTSRTAGLLLAGIVPMLTLAVFLACVGGAAVLHNQGRHGPVGLDNLADGIGAVVLGAGGFALGVALGRWVRFALAPVVAVVLVGVLSIRLNSVGDPGWNRLAMLSTAPALTDPATIFTDRAMGWHLAWLLTLVALVALVALARDRHDALVVGVGIGVVLALVLTGVAATRPMPAASAARVAERIASPAAHQDCLEAGPTVQVCTYTEYDELQHRVVDRVDAIATALPVGSHPLALRQSLESAGDVDLDELPPEVRRRLPDGVPPAAPGDVPLGYAASPDALDEVAFDLAFTVLGLPPDVSSDRRPLVAAGQARGVVALWLVTRGLDTAAATAFATAAAPGSADPFERGLLSDDPCDASSVAWSAQDLAAARALVAAPETDVARIVSGEWARWVDPATGTDDLLAALGLPRVGPFDSIEPRVADGC